MRLSLRPSVGVHFGTCRFIMTQSLKPVGLEKTWEVTNSQPWPPQTLRCWSLPMNWVLYSQHTLVGAGVVVAQADKNKKIKAISAFIIISIRFYRQPTEHQNQIVKVSCLRFPGLLFT